MTLAVTIPAYNCLPELLTCLNSLALLSVTQPRFYVQDDCSPDVHLPATLHPAQASVERNPVNLGFAGNVNAGVARTSEDIIFICNQDIYGVQEWSGGWDAHLLAAFEDSSVGIVAPRLLFSNGTIQSCGGIFDAACQPVHRCLGYSNPHHPEVSTPREVEWTTGAAFGVRRSLWNQLGGFDTIYRMYWEDVDACLRARELGWKIWYQPQCTLFHAPGSTGGSIHFVDGARRFKQQWVDSGKVKAGTTLASVRFW